MMIQNIGIFAAACLGLALASYIAWKKKRGERLVCMIGEDCDKVVHSSYARTLGIPNEYLGMLYYGVLAATYAVFLFAPEVQAYTVFRFLPLVTAAAAAFSTYLVFVQTFVLKEWCEWCLASAGLSILIAVFTFL